MQFKTGDSIYKTQRKSAYLAKTYVKIGGKPIVDISSERIGGNSTTLLSYDVSMDGLLQAQTIAGLKCMNNSCYYYAGANVECGLNAFEINPEIEIIFVLTYRPAVSLLCSDISEIILCFVQ